MSWSTAQVARMSGVTSRTLRHYDDIGLLPPAGSGAGGYRHYDRVQLLRLQEILLLRELGLGLRVIATVLDGGRERAGALREHHRALLAERDRLGRLARTVAATIDELDGGDTVTDLFEGFDPSQYEAEVRERWGETAATARPGTPADAEDWVQLVAQFAAVRDVGVPADDPRALAVTDRHYRWVCRFWTPSRESYPRLGDGYADDERFGRHFTAYAPGLADYVRAAMTAYAEASL